MKTRHYAHALAGVLAGTLAGPAIAAEEESRIDEIVVVGHPLSAEGLAQSFDVLAGDELERKRAANIGTTLSRQPGIHNAAFGAAVGRPVIHGLDSARVRVLEDRVDALDVSVTSGDHQTMVDPFLAERIEVIKGPSTLLYGSGAIGGVVDVHTGRIPHSVPDRITGGIETRFDDNAGGNVTAAKLRGGVDQFAWHLDATFKDADEYEIPDFAESARLRALEEAEEEDHDDDEDHEEEEVRGELPGSDFDSESFALGLGWVGDRAFAGASVSVIDAEYGLPGGHGHEHEEGEDGDDEEEEEGTPRLELEQTRVDVEVGIEQPFSFWEAATALNVRIGVNDYEHVEIEPDGAIATRFDNEAWEARAEVTYETDAHDGAFGLQATYRDFSAEGEEAFIAPVDTDEVGVFWVFQRPVGGWRLESGVRLGWVEHDPRDNDDESFFTWAVSAGGIWELGSDWQLNLHADLSSRAPVPEELYSDGPHLATQSFEIGDPGLDDERALSLSGTARYAGDRWDGAATVYVTSFDGFIFKSATGDEEDELPVFVYDQDDAVLVGIDAEAGVMLVDDPDLRIRLRATFDVVEGELDANDDNLPRIPPMRAGLGLEMDWRRLGITVDYQRVSDQDNNAPNELETGGYDDWSANVDYGFSVGRNADLVLFARGTNLTDDEQRLHTSIIKDFAPQPGRTLEFGARLTF